jgi:hypothetical protein
MRPSENVECGFRHPREANGRSLLWYNAQVRRLSQALAILLIGAALSGLSFEGRPTRLRRELTEGLLEERVRAAGEIRTLRLSDAAPLITLALDDPELPVQTLGVEAAIALRWTPVLDQTRALFESEDPQQRRLASQAEGELGDAESIPALTRALSDARALVREAAAEGLGKLGLAACAAALGPVLDDADTSVRVSAANALGQTPGSRATDFLLARTLDRTSEVRTAVIRALADRTDQEPERILPVLAASLEDESESVRLAATLGLGRARESRGVDTLIARIEPYLQPTAAPPAGATNASPTRPRQPEEALSALAALGRIDAPNARMVLVRALSVDALRDTASAGLRSQSEVNDAAVSRAFAEALRSHPAQTDLLARSVIASPHPSPELASALHAISIRSEGDPALVLPALAASTTSDCDEHESIVIHILARLDDAPSRPSALRAVQTLAERNLLDEAAREAFIAQARGETEEAGELAALAALSPPPIATILRYESDATRAAVLNALVSQDDPRVQALALRAITDAQPPARAAALQYLRAHPTADALQALLGLLEAPSNIDRFSLVEAVALLSATSDAATEERTRTSLAAALHADDPRLFGAAAAGLHAGGTEAHRALFDGATPSTLSVALARAQQGLREGASFRAWLALAPDAALSAHDFAFDESLLFPTAITRSFTALVLAREGALRESDVPRLCALAARHEPNVRANAVLALAAMRAPCEGIEPLQLTRQSTSSQVQLAALTWWSALNATLDAHARSVVTECAESALEPRVAEACLALVRGDSTRLQRATSASESTWLDVTALDAGNVPLPLHWVTLEFTDGSSLAARTDESGRIAMRVPAAPLLRLSDPFASVLEP